MAGTQAATARLRTNVFRVAMFASCTEGQQFAKVVLSLYLAKYLPVHSCGEL
jgi:hypothetical protein